MKQELRASVRVTGGGRIVIPAGIREQLGLNVGSELIMTVQGDCATIMEAKAARRRAQARVRQYVAPSASLSRELMAERRRLSQDE